MDEEELCKELREKSEGKGRGKTDIARRREGRM